MWDSLRSVSRNTRMSLSSGGTSWSWFSSSKLQTKWRRGWPEREARAKRPRKPCREESPRCSPKAPWSPSRTRSSTCLTTSSQSLNTTTSSPTPCWRWAPIWSWWAYRRPWKSSRPCCSRPGRSSCCTTRTTCRWRWWIWWSRTGWIWWWAGWWIRKTCGTPWMPKIRSRIWSTREYSRCLRSSRHSRRWEASNRRSYSLHSPACLSTWKIVSNSTILWVQSGSCSTRLKGRPCPWSSTHRHSSIFRYFRHPWEKKMHCLANSIGLPPNLVKDFSADGWCSLCSAPTK